MESDSILAWLFSRFKVTRADIQEAVDCQHRAICILGLTPSILFAKKSILIPL
jgi:hypothetical protein